MAIRRFRDHVADQNWFAVAVDLAIVVVGVFLGTEATSWNQDRSDRATAADYRQQIIANLKGNEADMATRATYYRQARVHGVAALRAFQAPERPLGEPFLVDAYQASQGWVRPFERSAYDEMVDSGVARKIGDAPTRAQLSGYYVGARGFELTIRSTTAYRERIRTILDFDVQDRIRSRCDDIVFNLPSGAQGVRLPDQCELGLGPAIIRRAVAKLRSAPGLEDDLARQIGDIDQKLQLIDRTARNARELVATLQR
jgi:hypothetical protein